MANILMKKSAIFFPSCLSLAIFLTSLVMTSYLPKPSVLAPQIEKNFQLSISIRGSLSYRCQRETKDLFNCVLFSHQQVKFKKTKKKRKIKKREALKVNTGANKINT